jgi:hypothetical protein
MRKARAAAIATGVVTMGLLVWLTVAKWEEADRVAIIASAVGAVTAAGIAIWAVLRTTSKGEHEPGAPTEAMPPVHMRGGKRVNNFQPT